MFKLISLISTTLVSVSIALTVLNVQEANAETQFQKSLGLLTNSDLQYACEASGYYLKEAYNSNTDTFICGGESKGTWNGNITGGFPSLVTGGIGYTTGNGAVAEYQWSRNHSCNSRARDRFNNFKNRFPNSRIQFVKGHHSFGTCYITLTKP